MDLLLLHFVLLLWLSVAAAGRWTDHPADRFLAAGAIAWANLLATGLLLSPFHRLGQPWDYFAISTSLALATALASWRWPAPAPMTPSGPGADYRLQFAVVATLASLAVASAFAALSYPPSSPAAFAYELPRALFQLGEGSLLPLQAADARLQLPPFNYGLLQTWALAGQPPLAALNFLNLLSWCAAGLAVNRLCRAAGASANGALVATWCAMTTTPILAHAATTDHGLPAAAALVAATYFGLDWARRGRTASAAFAGLSAGLAGGSTPATLVVVGLAAVTAAILARRLPDTGRLAAGCTLVFGLLPCLINLALIIDTEIPRLLASLQRTIHPGTLFSPMLLWPLWRMPDVLHAPSEESVGLGFSGLACLAAAVVSLRGLRAPNNFVSWLALTALSWLGVLLTFNGWLPVGSRDCLLCILMLAPAVAELIDRRSIPRPFFALGLVLAVASLWSSHLYLWANIRRPLAALVDRSYPTLSRPGLPPTLKLRLEESTRTNFISDGEDPLLLSLLTWKAQHFRARAAIAPDVYNIISRDHRARSRTMRQLAEGPAYLLIGFLGKPTAGIEFLGQVGLDESARDYFGISGQANQTAPIPSNCMLMLSLSSASGASDPQLLQADLLGLNPLDHAKLEIWAEYHEGPPTLLTTFKESRPQTFRLPANLHYLRMKIVSTVSGRELGNSVLTDYAVVATNADGNPDPRRLFATELVAPENIETVHAEPGLGALEGPFPQWDLPMIRWARAASIKLRIPTTPGLTRVSLRLEARLHVRSHAILEVVANGQAMRRLEFGNATAWHEVFIEFPARPGENIIELNDVPLPPEPDWVAYIERYPDVKSHAERIRQPLRETALDHYRLSGQREGRIMTYLESPPPAGDTFFFMFRRLRVEGFRP